VWLLGSALLGLIAVARYGGGKEQEVQGVRGEA